MSDRQASNMEKVRSWSRWLVMLDVLFWSAFLFLPYAWLFPLPRWVWRSALGLLIGLLLLRPWLRKRQPMTRGLMEWAGLPKLALALASVYIFIALFEGGLSLVKFKAKLPPIIFEGKDEYNRIVIAHTLPDPELLWRFVPGGQFQGAPINQLGFRDREVAAEKTAGVRRVISLGCSVTAQGLPGYPQYLHDKLQVAPPTAERWEALNLGVHGYSALQGLRLFQRMNPLLDADVVTIFFGWNDHWLAEQSDHSRMAIRVEPWLGRLYYPWRNKRIFAFLSTALQPAMRWKPEAGNLAPRLPPEAYRQTLQQLVEAVRAAEAVPVLITAPRRELTDALIKKKYARSTDEAEQLHDRYVEITRAVAQRHKVALVDLAALFARPEHDKYFAPDGIHLDIYPKEQHIRQQVVPEWQPGLNRVAEEVHRTLQQVVLDDEWQRKQKQNGAAMDRENG